MLADLLKPDGAAVLKRWVQLILSTYPPEAAAFLQGERDVFLNPVGQAIARETEVILEGLLAGTEAESLYGSLDNLISIRAVQDFSPSEAVGFMFLLKQAVRSGLGTEHQNALLWEDLLNLESRIDAVALTAFDLYMKRREKVFQVKANEAKRISSLLIERMNRL